MFRRNKLPLFSGLRRALCYPSFPLARTEIDFVALGRAVTQEVSPWLPTTEARVRILAGMWGLWWTKRHRGRFGFPCQSSFCQFLHHHNHSGWHNRPIGGRRAEWVQLNSIHHYTNLKKIKFLVALKNPQFALVAISVAVAAYNKSNARVDTPHLRSQAPPSD
jgi:hypothetical protein